ncbi:hypothetical protein HG536_0G04840 [Torulaspora globosa]|uniref:Transcription factor IIIC subunit 5 HTH domain-containing protein n=1 Tax=Torulaspora globosa TaxID=48254 RepID=A0A7G3ZM86_9SACH|nr:uncharacterized protein HG536_0G04840 [Torulaspora globosa]QLL34622.1 hypothetical protein HG536_0G04840 [Torulaspora globosa]
MTDDKSDLARLSPTPERCAALAKEYTLDIPHIPSLELPLCVSGSQESVTKAIAMCGGLSKVKEIFSEHGENVDSQRGLELYLNEGRDDDGCERFFNEHPIIGKKVPFRDESIILKIEMPKGTLAKHGQNIQKSLESLRSRDVRVTPVAIVNNTIKFREMSDFQLRLDNVPSAEEFKTSFDALDWSKLKSFVESVPDQDARPFENISSLVIDRTSKIPGGDFQLPPPPRLSMVSLPYQYNYKANPFATKKSNGVSEVKGTYIKNYQQFVHDMNDNTTVPEKPHASLQKDYEAATATGVYPGTKKESGFYESLEECLKILKELFARRPIWVKRHIDGIVRKEIHHTLKIALALLSFRFTMGPWRNTYIRFGVDPRSSAQYARYQTEYFKIERRLLRSPALRKHIPRPPPLIYESDTPGDIDSRFKFNGKQIPWYLMLQVDLLVEEPNIAEVYSKVDFLPVANELTGWFPELDLAKIRRIVKYELGCMVQGNYDFNQYKLKYFKNMVYVKESMIKEQSTDPEGDVNMDEEDNIDSSKPIDDGVPNQEEDEDYDNGVATGEADEAALEADEADEDDYVPVTAINDGDDAEDFEDDQAFDVRSASFQEIIERIAKVNPNVAQRLQKELNGLVNEADL